MEHRTRGRNSVSLVTTVSKTGLLANMALVLLQYSFWYDHWFCKLVKISSAILCHVDQSETVDRLLLLHYETQIWILAWKCQFRIQFDSECLL